MNFRRARHLVRRIRWTGSRTLNIVAHLESANENFLFTTLHTSKWNSKAIFLKLKLSGRKFEVFLENQFLSLDSSNWREINFTNFWVKKSSNWRETNFSDFWVKKSSNCSETKFHEFLKKYSSNWSETTFHDFFMKNQSQKSFISRFLAQSQKCVE